MRRAFFALFAPCAAFARRRQRGYNLVEVMIVIVVAGLIIGAGLVPLRALWQADSYRAEDRAMQVIKDAVAGYALHHSTFERQVTVENAGGDTREYVIPAGRPYLPCPDVDGDGYEDRVQIAVPGANIPPDGITITPTANPLRRWSNCGMSRGLLPWKTLGVPPADTWGNRYTYQVDDVMSNAFYGFDENTLPDVFDPRALAVYNTATGREDYDLRVGEVLPVNIGGTDVMFTNRRRPVIVCGNVAPNNCRTGVTIAVLAAGEINTQSSPIVTYRRTYQFADVTESAAYAVVSHGENGYGAVNHLGNFAPADVDCNYPATGTSIDSHVELEAVNFPFVEEHHAHTTGSNCRAAVFGGGPAEKGYLVSVPRRSSGVDYEFDDVVQWAMHRELTDLLLEAKKLPVRDEVPVFVSP